jgi:hypothetical protein
MSFGQSNATHRDYKHETMSFGQSNATFGAALDLWLDKMILLT